MFRDILDWIVGRALKLIRSVMSFRTCPVTRARTGQAGGHDYEME